MKKKQPKKKQRRGLVGDRASGMPPLPSGAFVKVVQTLPDDGKAPGHIKAMGVVRIGKRIIGSAEAWGGTEQSAIRRVLVALCAMV